MFTDLPIEVREAWIKNETSEAGKSPNADRSNVMSIGPKPQSSKFQCFYKYIYKSIGTSRIIWYHGYNDDCPWLYPRTIVIILMIPHTGWRGEHNAGTFRRFILFAHGSLQLRVIRHHQRRAITWPLIRSIALP